MGNITTAKALTFFDIETTSLDPKRSAILQITIITEWSDGKKDRWTTKIKPRDVELKFADKKALEICRFSPEEWDDAPYLEDVAGTIVKKLSWGPLIAHNIYFDISHITACLERRGWKKAKSFQGSDPENKLFKIGYPLIDTCALAYLFLPTEKQNLDALREHMNISKEGSHESEKDADDCKSVFYNILMSVERKND